MALEWLSALPHATLLRQSDIAYLLVNAAHIGAIGLLFGAIAALDLRLLGAARAVPLAAAGPYLARLAAGGLLLALLSGLWLFSVQPGEYLGNRAFLAKLGLVALGVANAAWLHAGPYWRRTLAGGPVPGGAQLHAALSLGLWAGAIVAGRWIGFL